MERIKSCELLIDLQRRPDKTRTGCLLYRTFDNKFVKIVNEGEMRVSEVSNPDTNRDMTYEYEVSFKMGAAVVINTLFGIWTILS